MFVHAGIIAGIVVILLSFFCFFTFYGRAIPTSLNIITPCACARGKVIGSVVVVVVVIVVSTKIAKSLQVDA